MLHQPLIYGEGISGPVTDINIETQELLQTKDKLIDIVAKHTGQNIDKVRSDTERNFYMSAADAKNYGIIDDIIFSRKPK